MFATVLDALNKGSQAQALAGPLIAILSSLARYWEDAGFGDYLEFFAMVRGAAAGNGRDCAALAHVLSHIEDGARKQLYADLSDVEWQDHVQSTAIRLGQRRSSKRPGRNPAPPIEDDLERLMKQGLRRKEAIALIAEQRGVTFETVERTLARQRKRKKAQDMNP